MKTGPESGLREFNFFLTAVLFSGLTIRACDTFISIYISWYYIRLTIAESVEMSRLRIDSRYSDRGLQRGAASRDFHELFRGIIEVPALSSLWSMNVEEVRRRRVLT